MRSRSSNVCFDVGERRACALRLDASTRAASKIGHMKMMLATFLGRLVTSHSIITVEPHEAPSTWTGPGVKAFRTVSISAANRA